jgi:hypothetical protein
MEEAAKIRWRKKKWLEWSQKLGLMPKIGSQPAIRAWRELARKMSPFIYMAYTCNVLVFVHTIKVSFLGCIWG